MAMQSREMGASVSPARGPAARRFSPDFEASAPMGMNDKTECGLYAVDLKPQKTE